MSDISVIGLGAMGAALAGALLKGRHRVTVWNRTSAKMTPLIAAGATGAQRVADALTASPIVLVCIDNYTITRELLGADDVISHLENRTVIQLSTGTPKEARELASWMEDHGVRYIDGAIIGGPENIHTTGAEILFAGRDDVYAEIETLVSSLSPNVRHVGNNIVAAATLDLAWLCQQYGIIIGVVQGAYLCETEGVSADLLSATYRDHDARWSPVLAETIYRGNFADTYASLRVWSNVAQIIREQAADAGVRNEFLDFMADVMSRGLAAGYGDEDAATLIKVLRSNGSRI